MEIGWFDGMKKKGCSLQQDQISHSKHNELKDQKTKEIPNQNSADVINSINYRLACYLLIPLKFGHLKSDVLHVSQAGS